MQTPPLPPDPAPRDHLLEDLAAATGLFNPERIWQEEELLDDLEEEKPASTGAVEPAE